MAGYVSDAVIRRLPGYYRHLRELEAQDVKHISSQQLGERMHYRPHRFARISIALVVLAARDTVTR